MARITTRSVDALQFFAIAYLVVLGFRILMWIGAGALILAGGAMIYQHRSVTASTGLSPSTPSALETVL